MFSVFDKHLLTVKGKTTVRKYVDTTDAQSVWKDFQDHMKSSSKGASEKRRQTQYLSNTTLDDNYKGVTEQFVLHFHEQYRQLKEISDQAEYFPPQIKLQLLKNAVRPIDDLRIVETLDKFQSITTGYGRSSSLKYQTYYDFLINACIRYDRTKMANIAKIGHIYQTSSTPDNGGFNDEIPYETPGRDRYMGIDTLSDKESTWESTLIIVVGSLLKVQGVASDIWDLISPMSNEVVHDFFVTSPCGVRHDK